MFLSRINWPTLAGICRFFTVETIEFVQRCALWQRCMPQSDAVQGRDSYVDYILHMFGLKRIENERVGTLADGIKDSDRNRLATAEIAMGTYSVLLYDQTSSGQDSLITYDLLQMLQSVVHVQHCAAVISLVQISPESFDLFDRVILLSEDVLVTEAPSVESCACVRVGDKVTGVCVRSEEFQYVESSDSASKVSNMLKASYSSILLQLERNLDEVGHLVI
ncbi:hypothetical protein JRQ81_000027 [Phrynocephalus forsythii]|uniref:ABC transporter family G domain-containing protein n=1 Tax=Phrynocephalus forsythii TaxID=171643 RepID=A0A9Q1AQ59_9SAUR|nr:hypothetical protein JRQ81_000027 [Phrynocephalus forsythii]